MYIPAYVDQKFGTWAVLLLRIKDGVDLPCGNKEREGSCEMTHVRWAFVLGLRKQPNSLASSGSNCLWAIPSALACGQINQFYRHTGQVMAM